MSRQLERFSKSMRHFIGLTYIKSFDKRIETALLQSHIGVKNTNAQFTDRQQNAGGLFETDSRKIIL